MYLTYKITKKVGSKKRLCFSKRDITKKVGSTERILFNKRDAKMLKTKNTMKL